MLISTIAVAALAGFGVWLWFRLSAGGNAVSDTREELSYQGDGSNASYFREPTKGDFRAVGIDTGACESPCQTAQELRDKRFLMAEAPMLPLPGCDAAHCQCSYVRHDDRRQFDRRANHDMHEAVCNSAGIRNRRGFRNRRRIE